jgi:hypothetical protein
MKRSRPNLATSIPDFRWQVDHYAWFNKFEITPEGLTRRIELTPTKTFRQGDLVSSKRPWPWHHWQLEAPSLELDTPGMNRHGKAGLIELVSKLYERIAVVRSVCPQGELHFETIISTDSACPSLGLDYETSRRIVELGATWSATIWPTSFEDDDKEAEAG